VESCEKTTELTGLLWPSSVCRQALQLSSTAGLVRYRGDCSCSNDRRIKLEAGLNKSAELYTCKGLFSIAVFQ
jgi:hypothetical protein